MSQPADAPADTWTPDPRRFLADLEAKPAALERLAASTDVRTAVTAVPKAIRSVLFLGMGSSRYAAQVAARRLRAVGLHAVAEYASTRSLPPPRPDQLVVAISASGSSPETLDAVERVRRGSLTVALTEVPSSPLAGLCDKTVPLLAGPEDGGVACRTFQHTGVILRMLEAHLLDAALDFAGLCGEVAAATADLLARRAAWLPDVAAALDGPDGVHVIGPAERWSSVAQSALMFREGPRRPATASETGDWSHVDVYLTKTTDYRVLLLTGSPWDKAALDWLRRRGATVVGVGAGSVDRATMVNHPAAADPDVAVHVETLVAELVAWRWWASASGTPASGPSSHFAEPPARPPPVAPLRRVPRGSRSATSGDDPSRSA